MPTVPLGTCVPLTTHRPLCRSSSCYLRHPCSQEPHPLPPLALERVLAVLHVPLVAVRGMQKALW